MNSRLIVKIFLAAENGALLLFGAGSTPEDKQNLFEPKKKQNMQVQWTLFVALLLGPPQLCNKI